MTCPICLGAGLVHTDAEFKRVEADRDLHRRALENACTWSSVAGGAAVDDTTVAELLKQAAEEASKEGDR